MECFDFLGYFVHFAGCMLLDEGVGAYGCSGYDDPVVDYADSLWARVIWWWLLLVMGLGERW